jgi:hypothetical protein
MNIGEPEKIHTIQPDKEPVPEREPLYLPQEPARQPDQEPARVGR